ncbi:MAG TPA: oligoendopeptidase F [Chthoniobacterales bacterium]|nr:oligoendopeptidase F [Chthoniobacterales bacterium]
MAHIPTRAEIAVSDTWDLTSLFATESDYQAALDELRKAIPQYEQFKGHFTETVEELYKCLEFDKSVDLLAERLGNYASLKYAEDGSNHQNLARRTELANVLTKRREASAFIEPGIQAIPDTVFEAFLNEPVLKDWRRSLIRLRRFRPHTLSEPEEKILAAGSTVIRAHQETFSQLTNVDMKFGVVVGAEGKEVPLSQSSYVSLLQSQDRQVRQRAFVQFYQEFSDHRYTLASSLAASIRGEVFYARMRRYPSARAASLFSDDIPLAVYDNLISTVRKHLPVLHEYYGLRREILGVEEIHQYDTFVPLVPKVAKRVSFDEAIQLVTEALEPLGNEYVNTLRQGLNSRWVDRYETKGKRSGAFSSSSYGNAPYILMNYRPDVFSDVFTLAHESGHSMHSWYAQTHQLFQDHSYPIFLAEVASTFNEELLTHYLLERADDVSLRAYLIDRQIEDIRSVLFRQTMFAEFEKETHQREEEGRPVTLDIFESIYRELLEAYYGPDFALDSELNIECLRIPHFYSAFYVYKYATGISAAIALANRVLQDGDSAVKDYLGFLQSGGSQFPIETLRAAGVDMSTPEPVEEAIELFGRRLRELKGLLVR